MAQDLGDAELWLPSEFLTDDELLNDFKTNGFGFNSDLSSPVESVIGSNETESDEDDFVTIKVANFSMDETTIPKGLKLSSSPQSTLYGGKPQSTRTNPNSDSVGWDFLHAAAKEAARQRLIDETSSFFANPIFGPTIQKPSPVISPANGPNQFFQAQAQARYSYQQLQYQLMSQQQRNVGGTTAWPTLQQSQQMQPPRQRTGTGPRAVFVGETGARKERTGTGVFLPRRFENNNNVVPKKPVCSVLLPEKVVHALNLNLDSSSHTTNYRNVAAAAANSAVGSHRQNNVTSGQQMPNLRPQQEQQQVVKQELGLPQEWTY